MEETKGYYSLIQYCPDLARLEAATIGVLLFCPQRNFLRAKVSEDNSRIIHFFGNGHDWKQINSFKRGIEERVAREAESIATLEGLERFIAQRANLMQITPPRPMRVGEPEKELGDLFSELVVPSVKDPRTKAKLLNRRVWQEIEKAELGNKVQRNVPVTVSVFGSYETTIPFGFQNGRYHLIQPTLFPKSRDPILTRASKLAIEGESLYKQEDDSLGPKKLVVLGKFARRDRSEENVVNSLLSEKNTRYVRWADRQSLWDEIRTTGKEVPT